MPFIPHTEDDIQAMLATIGAKRIDDIFDEIPAEIPIASIEAMTTGLSERDLMRTYIERSPVAKPGTCFVGAGAYEHYIPAAVWDIVTRGEFYAAYTPYQPEASQGTLQAIYEYQTMMTELLAMEVSNASLYDGASALAEAVLMAARIIGGNNLQVLVPANLHPLYRSVLKTIINTKVIQLIDWEYDSQIGAVDLTQLEKSACNIVIVSQPNFFGGIEAVDEITNIAHKKNALVIGVVNPIAMAMFIPPGKWGESGVDIACGEGQPLGVPLSGGGPYFGFLCCRKKDIRQLPGRIVGKTVDTKGREGFVLTLQAREQHIRRAKATSNICTNQGLLMTAATIYMRMLGGAGLQEVAKQCHDNSEKLKIMLREAGANIIFSGKTFHEFVVQFEKPLETVLQQCAAAGIQPGLALEPYFPALKNCLLVCVTETKTEKDLQAFIQALAVGP